MKTRTVIDGNYFSSYIEDYDIYFSTPIEKGTEEVEKRVIMMIKSYKNFIKNEKRYCYKKNS